MGLFGSAGVALGMPLVRVGLWWNRRPGDGLEALSDQEYEIVQAMAEALFPPGGNPPQSGSELNLGGFVDAQVASLDVDLRRVMKAGLHAIDDLTILTDWGLKPFRKHDLERRQQIIAEWETSEAFPKRGLLLLYKWYIGMGFMEHPGMLEVLDIDYICG